MVFARVSHGSAYLNSPRLFQTPLTDKCFRAVLQCFGSDTVPMLQGPQGDVKIDLMKSLAFECGMVLQQFNCWAAKFDSVNKDMTSVNPSAWANFFAGVCSTGSWGLVTDFDIASPGLRSIMTSDAYSLLHAKHTDAYHCFHNVLGKELKLVRSCNLSLTISASFNENPQAKCSDRFKSVMRSVQVLPPSVTRVAEAFLFATGFKSSSRRLANHLAAFLTSYRRLAPPRPNYNMSALQVTPNMTVNYPWHCYLFPALQCLLAVCFHVLVPEL